MYELGSLFSLNSCCLQQPSMCQSNFLLLLQNEFVYYFPFTNRSRCHLLLQICKVTISQMHCSSSGGEARSMVAIISLSPLWESMQGFQSKVQPSLLHNHASPYNTGTARELQIFQRTWDENAHSVFHLYKGFWMGNFINSFNWNDLHLCCKWPV